MFTSILFLITVSVLAVLRKLPWFVPLIYIALTLLILSNFFLFPPVNSISAHGISASASASSMTRACSLFALAGALEIQFGGQAAPSPLHPGQCPTEVHQGICRS